MMCTAGGREDCRLDAVSTVVTSPVSSTPSAGVKTTTIWDIEDASKRAQEMGGVCEQHRTLLLSELGRLL